LELATIYVFFFFFSWGEFFPLGKKKKRKEKGIETFLNDFLGKIFSNSPYFEE
jgi:hypothetical protein